jgi:hypothetical protein
MSIPPAIEPITGTRNSEVIFDLAKNRGVRNVSRIVDLTAANGLEAESIRRFENVIRHGGMTDIVVRRDGIEHHFQADWLNRLFRAENI